MPQSGLESKRVKSIIALFRGINVGGRNKLPMRELVATLADLGLSDIKTYIQSGNAVFHADENVDAQRLAGEIGSAIQERHGFLPQVLLLSPAHLAVSMAAKCCSPCRSQAGLCTNQKVQRTAGLAAIT